VLFRLPESLPPEAKARQAARVVTWRGIVKVVSDPRIGLLVAVGSLVVLGFAALEATFSLFLQERLQWGPGHAALGFAFLGLVSAIVQGGLIRRLVPRFGEPRLIIAGIATLAVGLAGLALVSHWPGLLAALLVVGVGQGLASPTIQGLLSRRTPAADQGAVFGTLTSAQTQARLVNYVAATRLLGLWGPSAPFWEASGIAVVALLLALWVIRRGSESPSGELEASRTAMAAPRR
jgi:predicted MFS family arabinose efflux permease